MFLWKVFIIETPPKPMFSQIIRPMKSDYYLVFFECKCLFNHCLILSNDKPKGPVPFFFFTGKDYDSEDISHIINGLWHLLLRF